MNKNNPPSLSWHRLMWLPVAALSLLVAPRPIAAQEEQTEPAAVLLEVEGILDTQDQQLEDGRHYDVHPLAVELGQVLKIGVASGEFDTYLRLVNPAGEVVAENDDSDGTNSLIVVEALQAGTYEIWVHGYDGQQLGGYQLTAELGTEFDIRKVEADQINQQGMQLLNQSHYPEALEYFEQSLAIREAIGDFRGVGDSLNNIGSIYDSLGQYSTALDYYQQSLAVREDIGDRLGEGAALNNIGFIYHRLAEYSIALEYFEQSLAIREAIGDRQGEGVTLNNIGGIYYHLGEYSRTLDYFEQSLAIREAIGDFRGVGDSLNNIGGIYDSLGEYSTALDYYQQSLAVREDIGDRQGEGITLNNIGGIYDDLGEYSRALEFYEQSLAIRKEIGDRQGEGRMLNNIGGIYDILGEYSRALGFYEQSLAIHKEIGDRYGEGAALNNIGLIYDSQGEYGRALELHKRSLTISEEIGDLRGVGESLNNIGLIYYRQGKYSRALDYFQQSLTILVAIQANELKPVSLNNIGRVYAEQGQPEIGIVFLKQAVNAYEEIRQELRSGGNIAQELQGTFTGKVSDTYRKLADLLLEQGRILEAQQVLELLKLEELQEFTRGEVLDIATREIKLSDAETAIWNEYDGLIGLGKQLEENGCNAQGFDAATCTPLFQQRTTLTAEFNDSVNSFIAEFRNRLPADPGALNPENFIGEANNILQTPGTALIYPVVLEDKLWVLWATTGGVVNSVSVPVGQKELGETVLCFRQFLENPTATTCETSDGTVLDTTVEAVAQDLYRYLIPPQLEQEFAQQAAAGTPVTNLVFSLDRVTRYIPMAVLHNGDHYLIEDFTLSTILSAGLTRTNNPLPATAADTSVLALGLSEEVPENPREDTPSFEALFHVPAEIEGIAATYPAQPWMDEEWNDATFYDLPNHQVLHLATHGKFVPTAHSLSYLILGNKEPFRIHQLESLQQSFANLSLVVLSACETALGEPDQDGIEINSIAHSFIEAGANTVLASLWQVSDGSTSYLMRQFYQNLAEGTPDNPVTISSALRQAQLTLLHGESGGGDGEERGAVAIRENPDIPSNSTASVVNDWSHPYYWAPFILIGNGL